MNYKLTISAENLTSLKKSDNTDKTEKSNVHLHIRHISHSDKEIMKKNDKKVK